ncbi:hypothetical protein BIV57_11000 [Mangrovactinospora gilvigrisea]|uniref:ApeA N-terminal domain-containing protein n=1 Tax=Mangrovactinospora gilvigrisea TaxID=1428644 RepID=A0A1J7BFM4_9ACTN|nr:HEPN domain-containing protein [Mangrovactinospora gilvigrisea]OIV37487.1 hypothetical protein BIV57_11000 [Mangrovactinospora gilvigrisea]
MTLQSDPLLGEWWRQEDPDHRVPGLLTRVDDEYLLTLSGGLGTFPEAAGISLLTPTAICGHAGKHDITLLGAHWTHRAGAFDVDGATVDTAQHWGGHTLLRGGHFAPDEHFTRARFDVTHLDYWWPVHPPSGEDGAAGRPVTKVVSCGAVILSLEARVQRKWANHPRSWAFTERHSIDVQVEEGYSLDELRRRVIQPVCQLLSIVTHEPCRASRLLLWPTDAEGPLAPVEVDPDVATDPPRHAVSPLFTAIEIEPARILPTWLSLACDLPFPVGVAEKQGKANLETQVVEAVTAAETLQRWLSARHGGPHRPSALAAKAEAALKHASGLTDEEKKKVVSGARFIETSLRDRLLGLVDLLGAEVVEWLFNGEVRRWSHVAQHARNSLSHGFDTTAPLDSDEIGKLIGVLHTTRAVLQLSLLVEAGVPAGPELLARLERDPHFIAIKGQRVADWIALARKIG